MRISFINSLKYRLVGDLLDAGKGAPVVIFSHGLGSGRKSPRSVPIARGLEKMGISSLLVDLTGHGESEGSQKEATSNQMAADLKSAMDFLETSGFHRFGLSGASYGGAAAVMAAADESRVHALVLRYSTMRACFNFERPCYELAGHISAPTLLLVGDLDHPILEENETFLHLLRVDKKLHVIQGAVHAFEEPDQIAEATKESLDWFAQYLRP